MTAPCEAGAKLSKLFYAYPGRDRSLRARGFFLPLWHSNGVHPLDETGSLTLVDDSGTTVLQMQDLKFEPTGDSFTATTDQGYLSIGPFAKEWFFQFSFTNPNFPPGFFRVHMKMCLNIGDDGIVRDINCQKKPFGGFLCHQ